MSSVKRTRSLTTGSRPLPSIAQVQSTMATPSMPQSGQLPDTPEEQAHYSAPNVQSYPATPATATPMSPGASQSHFSPPMHAPTPMLPISAQYQANYQPYNQPPESSGLVSAMSRSQSLPPITQRVSRQNSMPNVGIPSQNQDIPPVPPIMIPQGMMNNGPISPNTQQRYQPYQHPYQLPYQEPEIYEGQQPVHMNEPVYDKPVFPRKPSLSQDPLKSGADSMRKSASMRSLRFDPKRQSYHFNALSDIESLAGIPTQTDHSMAPIVREYSSQEEILRIPLTWWMNSNAKNHFVAWMGEFIGTTMFLFFAFGGTEVANINAGATTATNNGFSPIVLFYISSAFGFSLMVNVWIFFRISGGLFNPAVTLGMYLTQSMTMFRAFLLVIAQLCGSMLASILVYALLPTTFNTRTTLRTDTSLARGVFIEAILTAELVFTIFMLAKEKHKGTFLAPIGIGFSLFICELTGVYYTGGSLNPARSFGPCVINGVWDKEHWIYWVGPAVGAIIAVCFYRIIKVLEYEVANPGQDAKSEIESKVEKEMVPRQFQQMHNAPIRSQPQSQHGKEEAL